MKCVYCGERNIVDSKFCAECGRPLSGEILPYTHSKEDDIWNKINEVKEKFTQAINENNYKDILSDKSNPLTNMLIVFSAWLTLRTIGIIPFVILIRILKFLMGYTGLLFILAVTYVYSTHQKEIEEKVEEIKKIDYRKTLREIIESTEGEKKEEEPQEA